MVCARSSVDAFSTVYSTPEGRVLDFPGVGAWRSLVAHQSGGLVVVGSNPAAPTKHLILST
jgi:hypothetical protein